MPSDLEIAQTAEIKPIAEIAQSMGLSDDDIDLYGKYKAKVSLDVLKKFSDRPNGNYVVVTAITPTPLGEGKTTTAVGLGMALNLVRRFAYANRRWAQYLGLRAVRPGADIPK